MCANRQTNRWAQKSTVILTKHKSHFGGRNTLGEKMVFDSSVLPCARSKAVCNPPALGFPGVPTLGESGHGTRGSPAIGLSRPQREAAGQGLGASGTAWGSLRPPREPHRGDKRAQPGLWGAAALGGARGQERLLRGACARSTAAKMETPQTSPNPPSDSKARKGRCLSLSLNFA